VEEAVGKGGVRVHEKRSRGKQARLQLAKIKHNPSDSGAEVRSFRNVDLGKKVRATE